MKRDLIRRHVSALVFCVVCLSSSAVFSNSINFVVDSSLPKKDLESAAAIVLALVEGMQSDKQVGLVVFDKVFQRSVDMGPADGAQLVQLRDGLRSITPSDVSNVAVGIEKGISELKDSGGTLIVLADPLIKLDDDEKINKYKQWLELIVLPAAGNANVALMLVSPAGISGTGQANDITSIINANQVNQVITLADADATAGKIAMLLPAGMVSEADIVVAEVTLDKPEIVPVESTNLDTETAPVVEDTDATGVESDIASTEQGAEEFGQKAEQAASDSAETSQTKTESQVEQKAEDNAPQAPPVAVPPAQQSGGWPVMNLIVFAVVALMLLLTLAAIAWLLIKRSRQGKPKQKTKEVVVPEPAPTARYLAPNQRTATVLTRAANTSGPSEPVPSQPELLEETAVRSDPVADTLVNPAPVADSAVTAAREPLESTVARGPVQAEAPTVAAPQPEAESTAPREALASAASATLAEEGIDATAARNPVPETLPDATAARTPIEEAGDAETVAAEPVPTSVTPEIIEETVTRAPVTDQSPSGVDAPEIAPSAVEPAAAGELVIDVEEELSEMEELRKLTQQKHQNQI